MGIITHVPVMVAEVLQHARPGPGQVVVDCTLGDGGHARALLEALAGEGLFLGLDVDAEQIARARERLQLQTAGDVSQFPAPSRLSVALHQASFSELEAVIAAHGLPGADVIVADLGVSSAQFDDPARGLNYKAVGPLDMRLDRSRGGRASELVARLTEAELADLLRRNADEPYALPIARILKQLAPVDTSHELARSVRSGLARAQPELSKIQVKDSVRRTFQALRIEVNGELRALDGLLRALPSCLRPGGRAVIITFHVGEERRVREAFALGRQRGVFADITDAVIRPSRPEILGNRRSSSARLHWAIRSRDCGHKLVDARNL